MYVALTDDCVMDNKYKYSCINMMNVCKFTWPTIKYYKICKYYESQIPDSSLTSLSSQLFKLILRLLVCIKKQH